MLPQLSTAGRRATSTSAIRCMSTASTSQASSSSPQASTPTNHYRITLRRSAIGLPDKIKGTLASLGLKKRLQSVYLPQRSDIAGMILGVKELVHVENVRQIRQEEINLSRDEVEGEIPFLETTIDVGSLVWVNEKNEVVDWGGIQARKAPRGYTVVGNISNAIRNEEILQQKKDEL